MEKGYVRCRNPCWELSGGIVEAYRCPNCKIVLFSYGEETEKE